MLGLGPRDTGATVRCDHWEACKCSRSPYQLVVICRLMFSGGFPIGPAAIAAGPTCNAKRDKVTNVPSHFLHHIMSPIRDRTDGKHYSCSLSLSGKHLSPDFVIKDRASLISTATWPSSRRQPAGTRVPGRFPATRAFFVPDCQRVVLPPPRPCRPRPPRAQNGGYNWTVSYSSYAQCYPRLRRSGVQMEIPHFPPGL